MPLQDPYSEVLPGQAEKGGADRMLKKAPEGGNNGNIPPGECCSK